MAARVFASRLILADCGANALLLTGLALLGAAMGTVFFAWCRRSFTLAEFSTAGLALACLLSWIATFLLPAGSYLFFWPLAAAIAGLLVAALIGGARPPAGPLAGLPAVLATVLLFTPMIFLLYIFLTLQMITVVCVGLLIGVAFILCGHFLDVAAHQRAWRAVALVLSACAVISLAAGIVLSKPSSSHPRRDSLVYSLNADNHTAALITYDQALDNWTSQAFAGKTPVRKPAPDYLGGLPRPVLWASAEPLDLAPPTAGMEKDEQDQGGRKVRLKITPGRKEAVTYLIFDQGTHPLSIKIGERTVKPAQTASSVRLYGLGGNPAELEFTFSPPAKVSFWLLDQTTGLPKPAGPRPEGLIGNDDTMVCRKYDF